MAKSISKTPKTSKTNGTITEPSTPVAAKTEPVKPIAPKAEPVKFAATQPNISLEFVKPGAKQVAVAGSFNDWKPERSPLVQIGNGRWVGDLNVKPGRHEYLFVVDGQWLPDPNAKETVQNPFGGKNSVLTVSA
jgi:1,4-alpha-glucan branching enzyme